MQALAPRYPHITLPWHSVDRQGEPVLLRLGEPRDAAAWVDHLRRITTETPFMLQSEDDPLPTPAEHRSVLEEYAARPGSVAICAVRPDEARPVVLGHVTLANGHSRRNAHVAELSMGVGEAYWGRGLGAMLMNAALSWAVDSGIIRRISLSVFAENEVARRLYEGVGFRTEGVFRRYVRMHGTTSDLVMMGLWLGDPS
jgi:RimJ/RimL family protein N-acetyltransferase